MGTSSSIIATPDASQSRGVRSAMLAVRPNHFMRELHRTGSMRMRVASRREPLAWHTPTV